MLTYYDKKDFNKTCMLSLSGGNPIRQAEINHKNLRLIKSYGSTGFVVAILFQLR